MKLLLVLTNPYSSLDVLARASIDAVANENIEVYWLYKSMFEELAEKYPLHLKFFNVIHFINSVECFSYQIISEAAKVCGIISTYHHRQFTDIPEQFNLVDRFFYVSRFLEADIRTFGIPDEKTNLLHNGVDTDIFKPDKQVAKESGFRIGFFGAKPPDESTDRKGVSLLLEAAQYIKKHGLSPEFIIVGHGWKDLVIHLKNIGFTVYYFVNAEWDDLPHLYNKLDLYLITSRLEGGPLTLLEAGACQIPIISTPVGLALEVLSDPECGKLLTSFDGIEIAQAIMEDMRNPIQAHDRALRVYEKICKNWSWRHTYRLLPRYYQMVGAIQKNTKGQLPADKPYAPYLDFAQKPNKQREIALSYAMVDFAWRLYYRGDRFKSYQTALSIFGKVRFVYWWNNFLKNVISTNFVGIIFRKFFRPNAKRID